MKWTVANARRSFSRLLEEAREEPQMLFNRHRHIATVIAPDTFAQFMTWLQEREVPTVEDAFANLRQILQEEDYELTLPERVDRSNSFSEVLDELSD
jgi:hypothetical protein